MKPLVSSILSLLLYGTFTINGLYAQERTRQIPCFDAAAKIQLDSIKDALAYQGYAIVREASMTMDNQFEMPVYVPLTEGNWYHIIFIGDPEANSYEVSMFDYQEKQVVYQKQGFENNVIDYTYLPKKSAYHIIKPVQMGRRKKKNFCGYVVLFRKESGSAGD